MKRLYDEDTFERILKEAYRIVDMCTCSGSIKDTSCYSCLRNYENQRYHHIIQRRFILEFLDTVFDESLEAFVTKDEIKKEFITGVKERGGVN